MTLQQMRYAVMVADKQSFGKAAIELFISQPSLSNAIRGLEAELGIELFIRTTKGVHVSPQGYTFIDTARKIIAASDAVLSQYTDSSKAIPTYFSVSSLRYSFAIRAFSRVLSEMDKDCYDFHFHDGGHNQVIQDVATQRSEIGILDISPDSTGATYSSHLKKNHLEFNVLYTTHPHILLRKEHPLAKCRQIELGDLVLYPFINYDYELQTCSDELILSYHKPKNRLRAEDRSTLISLLRSTDGYAIGSGLFTGELYAGLVAIPVRGTQEISVGWIRLQDQVLSPLANQYVNYLCDEVSLLQGENVGNILV